MHLPPHIAAQLFGQQEPIDAERERQAMELRQRASAIEEESRRMFLRFGAIMCTCNPHYDAATPSAAGCVIHGGLFMTEDGRIV